MKKLSVLSKVYTFAALRKPMMKITILQLDTKWNNPDFNISEAERLLATAPKSDLYVLPETWTTGFAPHPEGIAEEEPQSVIWMQNTARRIGAALCGSIAIHHDGVFRNRCYFCTPDGSSYTYDKHHLFEPAGEHLSYEPGTDRTVVTYKGVRFLLTICFDLRFPEWCRYRGDYDAMLCVANWPEQRIAAWDVLTRARAIENQCLVVAANRCGNDPANHYSGHSAIIDAWGNVLAADERHTATAITANFDLEEQQRFRQDFPVLKHL